MSRHSNNQNAETGDRGVTGDNRDRDTDTHGNGLTLAVPRSRGAISGLVLLALGLWGLLVPILGSHFTFGYGPAKTFDFTAARLWLQILPGVVVAVAGLMIMLGGNRVTGSFWAYLAIAGGAWFVIGPVLADLHKSGYVGSPMGGNTRQHLESLMVFSGLGAAIILFAAFIAGRLSVVGVRDVRVKDKRHGNDHSDEREVETTPAYPATREVPVTTTHVRPVETPMTTAQPTAAPAQPGTATLQPARDVEDLDATGAGRRDTGALRDGDL